MPHAAHPAGQDVLSAVTLRSATSRPAGGERTTLVLATTPGTLPRIAWIGPGGDGTVDTDDTDDTNGADVAAAVGFAATPTRDQQPRGRAVPLLPQVSGGWSGRPGLAGYRLGAPAGAARVGADWSTDFVATSVDATPDAVTVDAADELAGLTLRTELEAVPGGAIRIRHVLTNARREAYVVEALDVVVPLPDRADEIVDLTGRWGRERMPQRHPVVDGLWLRESRGGRPGFDSATELIAGPRGFGFGAGEVWAVHVAWSGNSRYLLERQANGVVTVGGGELLLPGELVLGAGESYSTPWLFVAASAAGMDGLATQFHEYLRSLPAHPRSPSPVINNVWEAVYFDHDLDRLRGLADRAHALGVERFVLDDGWFGARRDDQAGLGDWAVSPQAWPDGLTPLTDHVVSLGMQFGLWFEPEMVNPDSDLFRAHPDWILGTPGRRATLVRNQLVLDLGRPEVREHVYAAMDAVLAAYPISFVKWDHNRPLLDAAAGDRHGAPGAHRQTLGYYELLDRLRRAHPDVEWESCASGGGRIDLGVLERASRVWTSDMTDALSRQAIQRWVGQLIAPEYVGAHVSAPRNHQTGRVLDLDFRVATAFFGSFGIEWDIDSATDAERSRLAAWIALYKMHRPLLHGGRTVRVDSPDDAIWTYGVVSHDRLQAVFAYVQLDEVVRDPLALRIPGLDPRRRYTADLITPDEPGSPQRPDWRGAGMTLNGAVLAAIGLPAPARRPSSALLVHLRES